MTENYPRLSRQIELEEEMLRRGIDRYRRGVERAVEQGRESTTDYGQRMLIHQLGPVVAGLKAFIEYAYSGKAGTYARTAKYLKLLTPEENAFIVTKTILDQVANANTLQRMAVLVASGIEAECQMRYLRGENPGLFDAIMGSKKIKRQKSSAYVRRLVNRTMTRAKQNAVKPWPTWPESDRLHLGLKCLEIFEEATGIIEKAQHERVRKSKVPTYYIRFTPAALGWIAERKEWNETLYPAHLYAVIPPKPWTSVIGGGYWTRHLQNQTPFVKSRNMNYLEDLRHTYMPSVYAAVNAIQETPWQINRRVFETLCAVWDAKLELGKLPPQDLTSPPAKPHDIETNVEARRAWAKKSEKVHDYNARVISRRFQVAHTMKVAEMALEDGTIYFPHQLDFRGRLYPVTMFLNPQSADYAKALVTFAEGKPIEDDTAAGWLAVHGANTYGYDKVSLQERAQWTLDHEQEILASAADPLSNHFWSDADKPWQFLAFCFEWQGFRAVGHGYVSSLPISVDGTCNGLQHFSAMLRDEVGGEATNLTPSETPQDIYQRVADVVIEALRTSADPLAQQWLDYGINRKTTKRSVMVVPYGGTLHACQKYVRQHVNERIEQGNVPPFAEDARKACDYLAFHVWQAIGVVVSKAREAMTWLQKSSKVMSKAKLPVLWTTPAGLTVRQEYPEMRQRKINTLFHGEILQLKILDDTGKLDPKKQATGIAPNFVHSMDAAALMLTVVRLRERGITSYAMVHDSYGTVAADTQAMGEVLREVFVEMYEKHDVLAEFRASLVEALGTEEGIQPPPAPGALDIRGVIGSPFFFA